jgi:hypothetical protein
MHNDTGLLCIEMAEKWLLSSRENLRHVKIRSSKSLLVAASAVGGSCYGTNI